MCFMALIKVSHVLVLLDNLLRESLKSQGEQFTLSLLLRSQLIFSRFLTGKLLKHNPTNLDYFLSN